MPPQLRTCKETEWPSRGELSPPRFLDESFQCNLKSLEFLTRLRAEHRRIRGASDALNCSCNCNEGSAPTHDGYHCIDSNSQPRLGTMRQIRNTAPESEQCARFATLRQIRNTAPDSQHCARFGTLRPIRNTAPARFGTLRLPDSEHCACPIRNTAPDSEHCARLGTLRQTRKSGPTMTF